MKILIERKHKNLFRMKVRLLIYIILGTQFIALCIWTMVHFNYFSKVKEFGIVTSYTGTHKQKNITKDGILLPPMGWNSWNKYHCDGLKESLVRDVADILVKSGLARAGYVYVNMDDCWQIDRNASGHIVADKSRFPNGIKALSDYIHRKGLKFGIYTDQGTVTCERRPGSYRHEVQDAKTYAEWGVDFVKNDDCFLHPSSDVYESYKKFWEAIKNTGRQMIHSVKGAIKPERAHTVGNMRRVGADIQDEWGVMLASVDIFIKNKLWKYAKPGFFNDLDMLEIGNGGLTRTESISHLSLWCVFKAPLLLGNDLSKMDDFTVELLTHNELLDILNDPLQESVKLVSSSNAKTGSSDFRVVTKTCNFTDTHQQWLVNLKQGIIKSKVNGKCLAANADGTVIVQVCKAGDTNQKWIRNATTSQIYTSRNKKNCITTRYYEDVDAKVRNCEDRTEMEFVKGPSMWWTTYLDIFHIKYLSKSQDVAAITFYEDKRCMKVGAPKDIMIFGGRLSSSRHVAVLLNRDVKPHTVKLDFSTISGLKSDTEYNLRDVWLKKNIGKYKNYFSANVESHATMTLVISPIVNVK